MTTTADSAQGQTDARSLGRIPIILQGATEAGVLALVALSPWFFGGASPLAEFLLAAGVSLLLLLWAAFTLSIGRVHFPCCGITFGLTGLFLFGVLQITPLPAGVLRWLSPTTSQLYQQLLPSVQEELVDGQKVPLAVLPAGSTLSVYPYATRMALVRFAAVFFVFLIVRSVVASPASFRRLAILAAANGTLLALFAFAQSFTSPRNTIYWQVVTLGSVFGPFVNRNHFAFYVNLCIGMGLGAAALVVLQASNRRRGRSRSSRGVSSAAHAPTGGSSRERSKSSSGLEELLHRPAVLWLCAALGVMGAANLFSLSRGGMLALLGGATITLVAIVSQRRGSITLWALLVTGAVGGVLIVLFGVDALEARFSTIWDKDVMWRDRPEFWARSWDWVSAYPLWGTGEGTFGQVEGLYLHNIEDVGWTWEHAHNEYLEALLEGGVVRLLLHVGLLGWAIFLSGRLFLGWHNRSPNLLALGVLFSLVTLSIHSFVEFGLHIPAIVLLATVILAQLSAASEASSEVETAPVPSPERDKKEYAPGMGGFAPAVGAVLAVLLAVMLLQEGWNHNLTARLRAAASNAGEVPGEAARLRQISYLQKAEQLQPADAEIQAALGQAYLGAFEQEQTRLLQPGKVAFAVGGVTVAVDGVSGVGRWPLAVACWLAAGQATGRIVMPEVERAKQKYVPQGLARFLNARALCPLMPAPHLRLAAYHEYLRNADPVSGYLERAQRLTPADPRLWYLSGTVWLNEGQNSLAWQNWRRSLELADDDLPEIVTQASKHLAGPAILEEVLPDKPAQIFQAASLLYKEVDDRKLFLEKALRLLESNAAPLSGEELHLKAVLLIDLEQPEPASIAYEAALRKNPEQINWRYELADLLYQEQRFTDARRELHALLRQQPQHGPAMQLLEKVALEIAKRRK